MLRMPAFVCVELVDRHINHVLKIILHDYLIQFRVILEEVLELDLAIVLVIRFCLSGLAEEMKLHLISKSTEV